MSPDDATPSPALRPVAGAGALLLAQGFGLLARVRRGKPIHPRGTVLGATLRRSGTRRRWGSTWLDEPGEDTGLVRFSRSVGLPPRVPDVLGLAVRFSDAAGTHDLLLATTGLGRATRFLLVPRLRPAESAYTCLLPYRAPVGPVVLAAVPEASSASHLRLRLLAAAPTGPWEPFGELEVALGEGGPGPGGMPGHDAPVAFDPVLHPLPGLVLPPFLGTLREGAYAGARRGRGEGALDVRAQVTPASER